MKLHERLRELRKKAGYSQEELAEELGVSRQAVSKWESGSANPDIHNLIRLSELYQVSTDSILLETASAAPEPVPSAVNTPEPEKETPPAGHNRSANGFLWFGLGILAVLVLYYATNGF